MHPCLLILREEVPVLAVLFSFHVFPDERAQWT